jgi:excisionase family DNA binding protein
MEPTDIAAESTPKPHTFLSPRQVAEATGLPIKRVRWLIEEGKLSSVKWGGRFYVANNAIEKLAEQVASGVAI